MGDAEVYAALHASIIGGELSPGERLVEEDLAERLGESRGAVRTALVRLDHDGLVVRQRNRGAHVRRIEIGEAIEIVEARRALESLAAGYAAVRRTDADAHELEQLIAHMRALRLSGELLAMSARNTLLHRRILEMSGHQVAIEVCGRLRSQMVRFQFRTVLAPGRSDLSLAEHERIVAAIAARDSDEAELAMRTHLTHVVSTLESLAADDPGAG